MKGAMMMKKKFSWLTSLVLVCAIVLSAATVHAAVNGLEMKADKNVVEPGDTVTVSVVMNEAVLLEDMTTVFQMELNYDADVVTYSSHKLSAGYDFLDVVVSKNSPVIKAYWIYMMDLGIDFDAAMDEDALAEKLEAISDQLMKPENSVREFPAGTVLSVTFSVKEEVNTDVLVTSLQNAFTISAEGDVTNTFDHSYSVKVCAGHTDADDDNICDNCGEGLAMLGDVNGDGKINARDAMLALRYVAGEDVEADLDALDVDGNSKINARDAMLILRYVAGEIDVFS
jgi:hypothetical protein